MLWAPGWNFPSQFLTHFPVFAQGQRCLLAQHGAEARFNRTLVVVCDCAGGCTPFSCQSALRLSHKASRDGWFMTKNTRFGLFAHRVQATLSRFTSPKCLKHPSAPHYRVWMSILWRGRRNCRFMTNNAREMGQIGECKKWENGAAIRHKKHAHTKMSTKKAFMTIPRSM